MDSANTYIRELLRMYARMSRSELIGTRFPYQFLREVKDEPYKLIIFQVSVDGENWIDYYSTPE